MKKGIVVVLAVAIIGALGVYGKGRSGAGQPGTSGQPSFVQSDSINSQDNPARSDMSSASQASSFKDGTYTGSSEDTAYGTVQVAVVVSGGKITDVNFLKMPNDRGHTQEVTAFSEPLLKQETLQRQSAHIDFVTGATQTSEGYEQSLQSALNQAA
jgi:uncharacterized protein with FMN-binding domain